MNQPIKTPLATVRVEDSGKGAVRVRVKPNLFPELMMDFSTLQALELAQKLRDAVGQLQATRATFHSQYATPKHKRECTQKGFRLGDLIESIHAPGEIESLHEAGPGDFCVVDLKTREKAFAVLPHGATPQSIKATIESHFDAPAFRVTEKMWVV